MQDDSIKELSFDRYRLDIWPNKPNLRKRLRLFRVGGTDEEIQLQSRDLEVLEYLVGPTAGSLVTKAAIANKVWRDQGKMPSVEHSISVLREKLDDRMPYHIIATRHDVGYIFLPEIRGTKRYERMSDFRGVDALNEADEELTRQAFVEFFGAAMTDSEGVIVLQSDFMDSVLPVSGSVGQYAEPTNRLYKARTFVNTLDIQGALLIQAEFRKLEVEAPELIISEHNVKANSKHRAAFKISMGLGFTDETTRTLQGRSCGPWMSVSRDGGDALSIAKELLQNLGNAAVKVEPDSKRDGFCRILPGDWDHAYVERWVRMLPPTNGPEVNDYALIFRNTRIENHKQVSFVVAGFTERSTLIAAHYLMTNWKVLWQRHVAPNPYTGSLGDFLLIIEGPSDTDRTSDWSEVDDFEITPEKLAHLRIDCDWAKRMGKS